MGREVARWAGWLITVDMMRDPGGATQTLAPRPRPATWVVAANVKPVGRVDRRLWFLGRLGVVCFENGRTEGHSLLQQCVSASNHLAIHEYISPCFCVRFFPPELPKS